jgi:hypothetical protein
MARAARLAGAVLAETGGEFYLVGNTKQPCDWAAEGFEPPVEIDALARPFIRLAACRRVEMAPPCLSLDVEGEELPRLLARIFVIQRTGAVSDRLWRLVIGQTDEAPSAPPEIISARWLGETPERIWEIVRDSVLRCT